MRSDNIDRQRLFDLVRYCRHTLFADGLITQQEYTDILTEGGGPDGSVKRLESYDQVRVQLDEARRRLDRLQEIMDERDVGDASTIRKLENQLAALKAERAEDTARLDWLETLRQNEKLCVSLNNSNGSCDEAPKGHAVYSTESDEEYTEITAPAVRELIDKISATANWPSATTGSTPSAIDAARAAGKEGE